MTFFLYFCRLILKLGFYYMNLENEKIQRVNIETQMKQAYIDYAMSVIVSRALPDARDGMKPVHRRILYAMYKEGNVYE